MPADKPRNQRLVLDHTEKYGKFLDRLARACGLARKPGESDTSYRKGLVEHAVAVLAMSRDIKAPPRIGPLGGARKGAGRPPRPEEES